MAEVEMITESKRELIDSVPKILVYGGTALLIWLFTFFIFAPLGGSFVFWAGISATTIMMFIAMVAIGVLLLKVLGEIRDICDAIGCFIAYTINKKATPAESQIYRRVARSIAYVIVVVLVFLPLSSLLNKMHSVYGPVLSGIAIVVIFLWAIVTLYGAGMAMSDTIEANARKFTRKILSTKEGSSEKSKG